MQQIIVGGNFMSIDYKKIGFIGAGNMANAIIKGIVKSGYSTHAIYAYDINEEALETISEDTGIIPLSNNVDIVNTCDVVVLAVKPHVYPSILTQIKNYVKDSHIIISIAAGISTNYIYETLGLEGQVDVIRVMPNTPAMVGEGVIAICKNKDVADHKFKYVRDLFACLGQIEIIAEEDINAVTGISGSGPAYVFMFIEALADGGVLMGLPRDQAYRMAAQTLIGSAKMYLDTRTHPGQLKDMVCSPGGTTIEAVYALERQQFRAAIMEAVRACAQKEEELSK